MLVNDNHWLTTSGLGAAGVVFSCIQPLLLPVCSLYFVAVYLIESHQHMYVWAREYESGGRMWSQVQHKSCACMQVCPAC